MKKSDLDLSNLEKCLEGLKNCSKDFHATQNVKMKEYIADACVKRYEYTVETAWKLMKKYLKQEYGKSDVELTMNNIFRFMEGYGFISSWEIWRDYYSKRNATSHEYNQEKAEELLQWVDRLVADGEALYKKLDEALED
jgi:nucleotidyltransferase substrate binding protein (TIGR01987 family)